MKLIVDVKVLSGRISMKEQVAIVSKEECDGIVGTLRKFFGTAANNLLTELWIFFHHSPSLLGLLNESR
jgi:hypothetical protein